MNYTFTQLILGLVVLPMTFLSQLTGANNPASGKIEIASNEKYNLTTSTNVDDNQVLMDLTLSIPDADIDPGEQICLPITVTNFTDIVGMEVTFVFDPTVVDFVDVQNFNLKDLSASSFGRPGEGANPAGELKLSWLDFAATGVTIDDGTAIFELCLQGVADGTENIILAPNAEAYKPDDSIVVPTLNTNTIIVGDGMGDGGGSGGSGSTDLTYSISSASINQGDETCLTFSVDNFENIIGTEINITYDPNVLEYKSVQALNLKDLSASSFGEPGTGSNPPGALKLSWLDFAAAGVTLADGTVIFEICFEAIVENGTSTVSIAAGAEAYDPDDNIITPAVNPGTVTVGDGSNSGGGGGTDDLTFNISSATIQNGDQTCLAFSVDNFDAITGMEFSITYDPTQLQFVDVQNLNLKDLSASSFGRPGEGANPEGAIKVSWLDFAATGVTAADGTVIFEVCFEAIGNGGSSTVTLAPNAEAYDPDDNILVPAINPATVTIDGGGNGGGGSDDLTFSIADASGQQGQEVCLDFSVDNFTDIVGMELTINYNPAELDFSSVQSFNLKDLSEASFGVPGVGTNQPGSIKLSWLDLAAQGVTLADGTVIFQVCFEPLISSGTATVSIQSGQEAYDINDNIVPSFTDPGTITVGGGGGGGTPSDDFTLIVGDAGVEAGDTICLPVSVANFNSILGMEFSVDYDPALLQFVQVQNFNLKDLSEASFGLPGVGSNQPGAIKLSWIDLAAQGVTLADGTVIFEACFVAVNSGVAQVGFDQSATLEITDSGENILPFFLDEGMVTITGDAVPTEFTIDIGRVTTQPGTSVDVPVTVFLFEDVLGMEFVISYDPAELQFESIGNLNLKDLSESSFGRPGEGTNQPGAIKLSWLDLAAQGVSVANGTVIFTINFTPLVDDGVSPITLDMSQPIEFIDANEQAIPYTLRPGSVTVRDIIPLAFDGAANITNVSCRGAATGAIDISVTGGSGDYSFSWDYQNATTEDLQNIPAGTYQVTVTDNQTAETISESYTVMQPATGLELTASITDAFCTGTMDGAITVNITGGQAPLSLDWGNGLPDGTPNQSNLDPGNYPLTVTDNNGCSLDTVLVVGQTNGINIDNINTTPIVDNADGAVALTVSGGTGNYTYTWTGPNGFSSTEEDISNLSDIGEYCVSISDGSSCIATACIMLTERLEFVGTNITQTCAGEANGAITVNVSGGMAPYSYSWSNGGNGTSISDLGTGNYTVTVTDNLGTTLTGTFEVSSLMPITLNPNVTPVTGDENNNNGNIDLSITGGAPGYTVRWDTGASSEDLSNLSTGQYCVTVTDQNACTVEDCFNVMFTEAMLDFSVEATDIICPGDDTGEIRIMVTGGVAPYAVRFSDDVTQSSANGMITRTGLTGGNWTFVITDASNATLQGTVTVDEPDPIVADAIDVVHDVETVGCTGRISLDISGGTPNYTVRWNAPYTGQEIIGLCEGNYIPTVIDDNNCEVVLDPIEVTTFGLTANTANTTCPDDADGALNLVVEGGSQPFSYEWRNEAGEVVSSQQDLINIAAGDYTVRVTEASGNELEKTFSVGTSSMLAADVSILSNYNGFAVSCPGAADGRVRVDAENGAGSMFVFEWVLDGTLVGAESVLENAQAGDYEVTIIDEAGCSVAEEVVMSAPEAIVIDALVTDISCPGENDGEIIANVDGSSGQSFSYNWSNGTEGRRLRRLPSGMYTLSVTDENSCTTTETYTINEPTPLSVTVETVPATDGCNGSAQAIVSGGVAPYFFEWNGNASEQDAIFENLCPSDAYQVLVTDAVGCSALVDMVEILDRRFPCTETTEIVTADGNGRNDVFRIVCVEEFIDNSLQIYNRYGQVVFETENYDNTWAGTTASGEELPEGPYYYVFEYTDFDGARQQLKGSVTILREE